MKKNRFTAIALSLALLFSGITAFASDSVTAVRSSQKIYIDGKAVDLLAYSIADNNYIRLRDLGKAVDFSVIYDVSTNSVHIDRGATYSGEIGETLPTPGDNVSAVLSDQPIYVKEIRRNMTAYTISGNNYVKLRDVGQAINLGMAYDPVTDSVYIDRQTAYLPNMEPQLLRPEAIPKIDTPTETPISTEETPTVNGEIVVPERWKSLPEEYRAVYPFLMEIKDLTTDTAKVNAIIRYVCERMEYGEPIDPSIYTRIGVTSIGEPTRSMRYAMFLDPPQVKGVCSHYAKAVYLLCTMAEIPCDTITSYKDNHAWNVVYADGEWWIVDSTNDDGSLQYKGADANLLIPLDADLPFSDPNPEETLRIMEIMVPGSTK